MVETRSLKRAQVNIVNLTLLSEVAVEILLGAEAGGELLNHVALGALGLFNHTVEFYITGAIDSHH